MEVASRPFGGGERVGPLVFDIDLYVDPEVAGDGSDLNTEAVEAIHEVGGYAVCYVSAGSWERWRPDAGDFPPKVRGRKNGWPGERWLDVRRRGILLPLMEVRADRCSEAGFDAIEWDNVDGYTNRTGFPITRVHQKRFDRSLAKIAHDRNLAVGLKNNLDQISSLIEYFDFAVNEQCAEFRECSRLDPFVEAGKPVYQVEYEGRRADFCPAAIRAGRIAILKSLQLRATPWRPCS